MVHIRNLQFPPIKMSKLDRKYFETMTKNLELISSGFREVTTVEKFEKTTKSSKHQDCLCKLCKSYIENFSFIFASKYFFKNFLLPLGGELYTDVQNV